jgi:translation initiation factor IF-1
MSGTGAFQVEGVIVEAMPNGTYRAELANGHRLLAFVAGRAKLTARRFAPGDKVTLALSPGDLSEGRILAEQPANCGKLK